MRSWFFIAVIFLFGCSEHFKQTIGSLSFQSNSISDGTLKVYAFGKGTKGDLLKTFDLSKETVDFSSVDASGDDLLLELSDFTYVDLFTSQTISMEGENTWLTIIPQSYENSIHFEINPVTTLLTIYVETLVSTQKMSESSAFSQALDEFNAHFGSVDLLTNIPKKAVEKNNSLDQIYYLGLVSFSKLAFDIDQSTNSLYTSKNLLTDLSNDLKDGFFDGKSDNKDILINGYFFDQFVMNYRLDDSLNEYLVEQSINLNDDNSIKKLNDSLKSLDRTFFKSTPDVDNQGPEIIFARPVDGAPVGNNYHVIINFSDASGPLKSNVVFYDNIEVTDVNSSGLVFEGFLNTLAQVNGPKELKVIATDSHNNVTTQSITVVSDNTYPTLLFTYDGAAPTSTFSVGGISDFRAEISDNNAIDNVSITSNNAALNALLVDSDSNQAVFHTVVDTRKIIKNGQVAVVLTVSGSDAAGNKVSQPYNVTIDNRGPQITLNYPFEGKTFHDDEVISVDAQSALGVMNVTASLSIGNVEYELTDENTGSPNIFEHTVDLPGGTIDGPALISITASDIKGNSATAEFNVFYNNDFFELTKSTIVNQTSFASDNLKSNWWFIDKHLVVGRTFSWDNSFNIFIANNRSDFSAIGSKVLTFPMNYLDTASTELQPFPIPLFDFSVFGQDSYGISDTDSVEVCDFNNDGLDDYAWATAAYDNSGNSAIRVHYGSQSSDGSWPVVVSVEFSDEYSTGFSCNDYNQDGYADLFASDPRKIFYGPNFISSADLTAKIPSTSYSGIERFQKIGDIDGDGFQDFIVSYDAGLGGADYYLKIFFGPISNGSPSTGNIYEDPLVNFGSFYYGNAQQVAGALGDLNQDGFDDFVLFDKGQHKYRIYYGSTDRNDDYVSTSFSPQTSSVDYNAVLKTCDIDGNGFKDIVFQGFTYDDNSETYAHLNQMAYLLGPDFTKLGTIPTEYNATYSFECKDVNYDKRDDIIVYSTDASPTSNAYIKAGAIEVFYDLH